jgi:hypothetical protein
VRHLIRHATIAEGMFDLALPRKLDNSHCASFGNAQGGSMSARSLVAVGVAVVLALGLTARLAAQAEPAAGTWVLNVAKSKVSPGPGPQSATLTIAVAGQGVRVTTSGVAADGSKTGSEYTANFDGKEVPIKGPTTNSTVALKRINANTVERTDRVGGKVTVVITRTLAADGKTLTITAKGVNAQGQKVDSTTIYERK